MFIAQLQSINSRLECLILMTGDKSAETSILNPTILNPEAIVLNPTILNPEAIVLNFMTGVLETLTAIVFDKWELTNGFTGSAMRFLRFHYPIFYIRVTQNKFSLTVASLQFNNDELFIKSRFVFTDDYPEYSSKKGTRPTLKVRIDTLQTSKQVIIAFLMSCVFFGDLIHKALDPL